MLFRGKDFHEMGSKSEGKSIKIDILVNLGRSNIEKTNFKNANFKNTKF